MAAGDVAEKVRRLSAALGQVTRQDAVLTAAEKRLCAYIINNAQHQTKIEVNDYLTMLIAEVERERAALLKLKDTYYRRLEEKKKVARGD